MVYDQRRATYWLSDQVSGQAGGQVSGQVTN